MPTALVLSAGGMFGAYQAGAWKGLAQRLSPEIVVGASAGSLNAWAIAGGCSPEDLIAEWLNRANASLSPLHFPFPPWRGCFDVAPLNRRIAAYFASFQPRVHCGITMVEIPRLRRTLVCDQEITADHVRASCAVPFGYPAVRIGGKMYVDGGLLDTVPVWAAVEMGATRVIVVNALPWMPSRVMRTAVQAFRAIAPQPPPVSGIERIDICPAGPLGSVREAIFWDEKRIRRWIEQGECEAREQIGKSGI